MNRRKGWLGALALAVMLPLAAAWPGEAELVELTVLVERCAADDPHARRAAIEAVRTWATEHAALLSPPPEGAGAGQEVARDAAGRRAAACALGFLGRPEAAAALTPLLESPDDLTRRLALEALGYADPARLRGRLVRLLRAHHRDTRLAAARALGQIPEGPERSALIEELAGRPAPAGPGGNAPAEPAAGPGAVAGAYALALLRETGGPLAPFLASPRADVVAEAALALANLEAPVDAPGGTEAVAAALAHPVLAPEIRRLLLGYALRFHPAACFPSLLHADPEIRRLAVAGLDPQVNDQQYLAALVAIGTTPGAETLDAGPGAARTVGEVVLGWLVRLTGRTAQGATLRERLLDFERWLAAGTPVTPDEAVARAIERGVAFLIARRANAAAVEPMRYPVALTGMAVYTLLKCGVALDHAAVQSGLAGLLAESPEGTYSAGLVAMALGACLEKYRKLGDASPRPGQVAARLQQVADALAADQSPRGGWGYGAPYQLESGPRRAAPASAAVIDLSCTQFALLGLRAAANAGARVDRAVWQRALVLFERVQCSDGGFPYRPRTGAEHWEASPTATMTAAALYGLLIVRTSLEEKLIPAEVKAAPAWQQGWTWLSQNYGRANGAVQGRSRAYYWLYSIERLCMVAGETRIDGHDWYLEGAEVLVRLQQVDGGWNGNYGETVDTCFALLFLRRAYVATVIHTGAGHEPAKR